MSSKPVTPLKVAVVPVTPFQQNCSVLRCEATGRGALIDPGGDVKNLLSAVAKLDVQLEKILLTHGHLDHVGGTAELVKQLGLPVEGPHEDDRFLLDSLPEQAQLLGFPDAPERFTPTRFLNDGDRVTVGDLSLLVKHCPGHTPGHIVFYSEPARLAFVGDVIFKGSIGRTDFPRGDHATLLRSIHDNLLPLGDDVAILPGHGPTSTLGYERRTNPFLVNH